jgi:hypothetical protein
VPIRVRSAAPTSSRTPPRPTVELTADDLSRIDAELPETVGERYDRPGWPASTAEKDKTR